MRLSPPTKRTFYLALALIVAGIVLWFFPIEDLDADIAFWVTAAGGILLVLGSVFNRI